MRLLNTITKKHSMVSDLHILKLQMLLGERNIWDSAQQGITFKKKRERGCWLEIIFLASLAESQVQNTSRWSHTPAKHVFWNTNPLLEERLVFHKGHLKIHLVTHFQDLNNVCFLEGRLLSVQTYTNSLLYSCLLYKKEVDATPARATSLHSSILNKRNEKYIQTYH